MWAWQTKSYGKGEDPLDEWKKRRADGTISNLDDQYGDEKKKGGIPIPQASFGVGGEFGVGGKVCPLVVVIIIALCNSVDGAAVTNSHFLFHRSLVFHYLITSLTMAAASTFDSPMLIKATLMKRLIS
jgi:hypothetical protein